MSLNVSYSGIRNWERLWLPSSKEAMKNDWINDFREDTETGRVTMLNPVTKALAFRMIAVGLNEITEANAAEFYARSVIFERITNTCLIVRWDEKKESHEDIAISPHHVFEHIGLSSNVSNETWAQWRKRMVDYEREEQIRFYNQTDFASPPENIGLILPPLRAEPEDN